MTPGDDLTNSTPTLPFDTFWNWLLGHPNCILRAGSRESVFYDDDDYHWNFSAEGPDSWLVQVIRGKRLVGEMLVLRDRVAYVQVGLADQEGEYLFELVSEDGGDQGQVYFFVLSHAYEPAEETSASRVH